MTTKAKTEDLFNANDGLFGRDGGPYLDEEQRRTQEVVNARREDREPDFDNLPLTPGINAVRLAELAQSNTTFRLAGQEGFDVTKPSAEPVGKAPVGPVTDSEKENDAKVKSEQEATKDAPNVSKAAATTTDDVVFDDDSVVAKAAKK